MSYKKGGFMKIDIKKFELLLAEKCIETRELSKISGLAETTITRIKKGQQNAKPVTIGKIARALNVDVTDLLQTEN